MIHGYPSCPTAVRCDAPGANGQNIHPLTRLLDATGAHGAAEPQSEHAAGQHRLRTLPTLVPSPLRQGMDCPERDPRQQAGSRQRTEGSPPANPGTRHAAACPLSRLSAIRYERPSVLHLPLASLARSLICRTQAERSRPLSNSARVVAPPWGTTTIRSSIGTALK